MTWSQAYDPMGGWLPSTLLAAVPVFVLLGTLAFLKLKAHWAASLGLLSALFIALDGGGKTKSSCPERLGQRVGQLGLAGQSLREERSRNLGPAVKIGFHGSASSTGRSMRAAR